MEELGLDDLEVNPENKSVPEASKANDLASSWSSRK